MAGIINFDIIPDLVDNTEVISRKLHEGFVEAFSSIARAIQNTEQEDPLLEQIKESLKIVEENYNRLVDASKTHTDDLSSMQEIREMLEKRDLGIDFTKQDDAGVKMTSRVDAIGAL